MAGNAFSSPAEVTCQAARPEQLLPALHVNRARPGVSAQLPGRRAHATDRCGRRLAAHLAGAVQKMLADRSRALRRGRMACGRRGFRTRAVWPRFGVASAKSEPRETEQCWVPRAWKRATGTVISWGLRHSIAVTLCRVLESC